jgi:outer membrane receptor protein involved in Fe transport
LVALSELPVVPNFKANLIGRYTFNFLGWEAYAQGALVYSSDAGVDLRVDEAALIGRLPAYTLVDLSTGFDTGKFTVDFYLNNVFDDRAVVQRTTQCAIGTCFGEPYDTPAQPRTFGLRVGHRF